MFVLRQVELMTLLFFFPLPLSLIPRECVTQEDSATLSLETRWAQNARLA